jgi:predicted ATPase
MINRIAIGNFKSIQTMDIELRPINVLIGANGAGKSNFIGFFKFVKNIYDGNLQDYLADEVGAENVLYFGLKKSDYLSGEIEFDKTNVYYFDLKANKDGDLLFSREGTQYNRDWHGKGWDDESLGKGHKESLVREKQGGRYGFIQNYMDSFKVFHFHDTSKTAKIKLKGNIDDNKGLREDGSNLAAYLYLLQEKYPKNFKKIEMVIRSVAPYFERFNLSPDRKNEAIIRLEWSEKGSDKYFNATHLSDGTLRFMALTTLLLQPKLPKTIIIDEPELGLHPFAINKLAGMLQKVAVQSQVIISTQSVNLVDNFEPEAIITVDRKENQSVFERKDSVLLQHWLHEYSGMGDLWNKNIIGGRP